MNEPTVEDIVKYVLKHEREALGTIGGVMETPQEELLKNAGVQIMSASALPRDAIMTERMFPFAQSYQLASNAYDKIVKERTVPELSDEVKRIGLHCIGKIDESWEWRVRPDDSLSIFNIDNVLIDNFGKAICNMFNSPSRKPRLIVAPLIGVNYGALLNTKGKERLEKILTTGIPKQYTIKDFTVECDTEAMQRQYTGWQRPVGEVRVEFGVREQ